MRTASLQVGCIPGLNEAAAQGSEGRAELGNVALRKVFLAGVGGEPAAVGELQERARVPGNVGAVALGPGRKWGEDGEISWR